MTIIKVIFFYFLLLFIFSCCSTDKTFNEILATSQQEIDFFMANNDTNNLRKIIKAEITLEKYYLKQSTNKKVIDFNKLLLVYRKELYKKCGFKIYTGGDYMYQLYDTINNIVYLPIKNRSCYFELTSGQLDLLKK